MGNKQLLGALLEIEDALNSVCAADRLFAIQKIRALIKDLKNED